MGRVTSALVGLLPLAMAGSSLTGAPVPLKDYDCLSECSGQGTAYCLKFDVASAQGSALHSLYQSLNSGAQRITAADLRRDFGIENDPCGRGDTVLQGDQWSNRGSLCDVTANVDFGAGVSYAISLEFPGKLVFRRHDKGGAIVLETYSAPVLLRIDDPDMNHDWGGAVLRVVGTSTKMMFQMPAGCLEVPYA